jgi:DNA-directed RNA polymerase specialized sigma subunit
MACCTYLAHLTTLPGLFDSFTTEKVQGYPVQGIFPNDVSHGLTEFYEALLLSGAHTPDCLNGPASLDDSEGYTLMDVQEDESTPLVDIYNKARLQDVIGTLDQKHQDVLNLRFTEGRTKAEIARHMGLPQSDVLPLLQGSIEEVRSRV